ncbi:MAG: hypothetical protein NT123_16980, partial [Proteobacteria bacterium]|nr:hypothetical protein [Pseudomonadota bacterium]
ITLGGGSAPSTTAAIGPSAEGILINGAQLQSGTGNIILNGAGLASGIGAQGIRIANGGVVQTSSGTITMTGVGGAGNNDGVRLNTNSSILSGSGAIQVKGTRTGTGVDISTVGGGNVIGGATSSASTSDILLEAAGTGGISTDATIGTSGSVTLNASQGGAITQTGGQILATGGSNSALRLLGNAVTSTAASVNSASNDINVLVASLPGSTSSLSYRDANGFDVGSLTKPTNQGGADVTHNGITIGTATGASNTLTLNAFGAVTQTQVLTAGALQLLGGTSTKATSYTLTNINNDVSTLAANVAGNISYRELNTLIIGTVTDAPTGTSTVGITTAATNTLSGSVTLNNTGTLTVVAPIYTAGDFVQSGIGTTVLSNDIVTSVSLVQFAQPVLVAGGPRTIDTTQAPAVGSSGTIQFLSTIDGGGNSLTLKAQPVTGSVSVAGTASNLANFTISGKDVSLATVSTSGPIDVNASGAITLNNTVTTATGSTVTLNATGGTTVSGALTAPGGFTSTSGGNFINTAAITSANGSASVSAGGDLTANANISAQTGITAKAGGAFSNIAAITAAAGPVSITSTGGFSNSGSISGSSGVTASAGTTFSDSGTITAGSGASVSATSGGDMTISGNVTGPAGVTLKVTGADRILTHSGGTISSTNSAVSLIADEMVLTSTVNAGSGAVVIKPNNAADAIQLGAAAAATNNAASTLELSNSELNTITTTGGLTIGASNNTGAITVAGALTPTAAQNGFTLLNNTGGIAINAPVTYAAGNGNLTLTANGGGVAAGAITSSGAALDVSGTLAMNAATGVGTLAAPMVLSHAAGTKLAVANTTSGGVFERADVGDLNIDFINNLAPTGAGINLNAGTNLNINGTVQSADGGIQFVAGNDSAYTAAGGFGLSPASVAVGTLGGVNINGQVIARNAGAISIYSTGSVKQSATVAAGLQSIAAAGNFTQGALKVRTFNNTDKAGVIDLQNNLAGTGNNVGPITLEARLAGSIKTPPYANSNIDYKSINGTNISGIGTAGDFSLVAPSEVIDFAPSQTIDLAPGSGLSGHNVSLIATAGDVTIKSAITTGQINGGLSGGSLNLYATGNIVLNNPGGNSNGVVIGKDLGTLDLLGNRQYEKFDHTLTMIATGDIKIYGTIQMVGDLALRANASASEASGPAGTVGLGAGKGSVIIAGSAANPVEVRAKNIVVGQKDANGKPLPVQNLIIDNSANKAANGKFLDTTLRADEKLDIYLNGDQGGPGTSGNIIVTGGNASATSTGISNRPGKSSALAALRGDVVTILGVRGGAGFTQGINPSLPYTTNSSNITLTGGTATSDTGAGGGALAAADALILGDRSKFIDIGGNLVMQGGTADSKSGGQTSAAAKIDPVSLTINTGGYIKMMGGTGAGAPAGIVNAGDIEMNIGGKFDYTYTDSAGSHTIPGVGLLMVGGTGSGIYDRKNQLIPLISDESSQVRVLFGAVNGGAGGGTYVLSTDPVKATAFIQSASPRGFDDSLMAYIIFAANEETRTGRIRTSTSSMDDSSKPSCN